MSKNYSHNFQSGQTSRKNASNQYSQQKKMVFILLIIFLLVILPMALIISQSLRIVNLNYELERLENNLSSIEESNNELERQVARKNSLSRIENIAREELNMVEANESYRLAVNIDQSPAEYEFASQEDEERNWLVNLWENFSRAAAASFD